MSSVDNVLIKNKLETTSLFDIKESKISFKKEKENAKSLNTTDVSFLSENYKRTDKYGNPIVKKNKQHKVTFSDQFPDKGIAVVSKVESYKKHNVLDEKQELCFKCVVF
jgi:hypothetical protein